MIDLFFPNEMIWMERFIAIAIILGTMEFLQIRRSFSVTGVWSWVEIKREYLNFPRPLFLAIDFFLKDRNFVWFLWSRLIISIVVIFFPHPILWGILWLGTLLIAMRWRGTFNGGSDYMTIIVVASIFIARSLGENNERWVTFSLGYVAFQVCLSFTLAGVAKLRREKWRNGEALLGFLKSNYYGVPSWIRPKGKPFLAAPASWFLILFECFFPIALFDPKLCLGMIVLAIIFQLINALIFGLNRFVWAWLAAYPALYWCSQYIAR